MTNNDGGPAFAQPCNLETCEHTGCKGMSLRAYFAGQIVANSGLIDDFNSDPPHHHCVTWLFDKAQAMVDEETRRQGDE